MFDEEELKKDLKNLPLQDVVEKYNLSFKEIFSISLKYNKYNVKIKDDAYIYKTSGGNWVIRKFVNGKMRYYGTYNLKKDASLVVEELRKVDWDENCLSDILEEFNIVRCRR